jgi:hypothetical protein
LTYLGGHDTAGEIKTEISIFDLALFFWLICFRMDLAGFPICPRRKENRNSNVNPQVLRRGSFFGREDISLAPTSNLPSNGNSGRTESQLNLKISTQAARQKVYKPKECPCHYSSGLLRPPVQLFFNHRRALPMAYGKVWESLRL